MARRLGITLLGLVPAAAAIAQGGGDWPQYLGPSRNGEVAYAMPAAPRLTESWRAPVPAGSGSIIVSGARAFTVGSDGEQDVIVAFDARTGAGVWRRSIGRAHADAADGPGATPAAVGDLVIAVGSSCAVHAVRAADGSPVWRTDLVAEYKSRFGARGGCSMSPLVSGGLVVLPTGAAEGPRLVALDAATGKQAWASSAVERSMNTSPAIRAAGASPQIVYHHVKAPGLSGLTGVNPATGSVEWTFDGDAGMSFTTPLPLGDNRVLLQTWVGSALFEIPAAGRAQSRQLWASDALVADNSPALHHGGHLFGFGGNSGEFFSCVEAASGTTRWSSRIYRGTALLAGSTIVVLSESAGFVRLVAAEPAAYRELARLQVFRPGARTYAPPSFAGGRIYVRNLEEIVAVAVQ